MNSQVTCLVVDDDVDDQEIFFISLSALGNGYKCHFASSATEAIAKLNEGFAPDFIFLDLNMPKINGMQCLLELKKAPPISDIPVIIYTTASQQVYIDEAFQNGAKAFITKPSRIEDLTTALNEFFTGFPNQN